MINTVVGLDKTGKILEYTFRVKTGLSEYDNVTQKVDWLETYISSIMNTTSCFNYGLPSKFRREKKL